jgi:hypothetical protein
MYRVLIIMLGLLMMGVGAVGIVPGHGDDTVTTTFIGSTIEGIDTNGQKVTIRTNQGKSWSFQVASAELMKDLRQGDRASIELDADGRVKKIVKTGTDQPEVREIVQ